MGKIVSLDFFIHLFPIGIGNAQTIRIDGNYPYEWVILQQLIWFKIDAVLYLKKRLDCLIQLFSKILYEKKIVIQILMMWSLFVGIFVPRCELATNIRRCIAATHIVFYYKITDGVNVNYYISLIFFYTLIIKKYTLL